MTDSPNSFTPKDLSRLQSDSLVAAVEFHHRLESTNDRGLLLAANDDLPTPLLILTQEQTKGRGRGENRWLTRAGALTFSLVVDEDALGLPVDGGMAVSLVTAIAVRDALATVHQPGEFHLKWPNDVWLGTRKVAGILLERPAARPGRRRLVVGIGVNVNNPMQGPSASFNHPATSLRDATGQIVPLAHVLHATLSSLRRWYAAFALGDADWVAQWRRHCLLQGRHISAQLPGQTVAGVCGGIDPHGALLIHTPAGARSLSSGSIETIGAMAG